MSNNLLARVIMLPDGSVHLAVPPGHTIACTPKALSEFLTNPSAFINKGFCNYPETTLTTNRLRESFMDIRGLTLLKLYNDLKIECIFPKIFCALFSDSTNNSDESINLKDIIMDFEISDERHFLMRFFYEFTNSPTDDLKFDHFNGVSFFEQGEIMKEAYDSFFSSLVPLEKTNSSIQEEAPIHYTTSTDIPKKKKLSKEEEREMISQLDEDMVSDDEYALIHGKSVDVIRYHAKKGAFSRCVEIGNRYYIDKKCPYPDRRAKRETVPRDQSGINSYYNSGDLEESKYDIIQRMIAENEGVSPDVRKYIRSDREIKYYRTHGYREVKWDGRYALIIDIDPDYFCKELRMSNRDIILQLGRSPVVPDKEKIVFEIHHVGQEHSSPFAIIPANIHRQEKNSLFHWNDSQNEDLHGKNFEEQKKSFWRTYIEMYDKYGSFNKIPSVSLKTEYERKQKEKRQKKAEKMPKYRKQS